jgi:hypothetical protein
MSYGGGYAPQALFDCYNAIHAVMPQAINAGIYGDKPGYHNCRNGCSSDDYSVQMPDDKTGDPNAGAALDVTLYDPADMAAVTQRLIDATQSDDPRMYCLREFFGTVDGVNVTGMDVRGKYWVTSDDSHLWHVHLSFYRKYCTLSDWAVGVAQVFTGQDTAGGEDVPETYFASGTQVVQNVPESEWAQVGVDDDCHKGIITGPASFKALANFTIDGLPVGATARVRFMACDYKSGNDPANVTQYPAQEIVGTAGGTYSQIVQFGKLGTAKKDGWRRDLRLEATAPQSGVTITRVGVNVFYTK